jgi:hypothetical protein
MKRLIRIQSDQQSMNMAAEAAREIEMMNSGAERAPPAACAAAFFQCVLSPTARALLAPQPNSPTRVSRPLSALTTQ